MAFCLACKRVGGGLEAVLGGDQRAVQLVIGHLQIGDAVLIGRLHLLVAMILGGDDAVLEDHIDGGERHPAQEDQDQPGKGGLQRRAEGEELHPPVAADIDLAFREGRMEPCPDALQQRCRLSVEDPSGRLARPSPPRGISPVRAVPIKRRCQKKERELTAVTAALQNRRFFIGFGRLPARPRHGRAP